MILIEQLLREQLEREDRIVFPETQADFNFFLGGNTCVVISVAPESLGNGPWSVALASDVNFNVLTEDFDECLEKAWELAADIELLPGMGNNEVGWISSVDMTMLPIRVSPIPGTSSGIHQVALAARIVFEQ